MSGNGKEEKVTPLITPLEKAIALTIAAAPSISPTSRAAAPLYSGWVYAAPQCVGAGAKREWTVFARHSSGHGVVGRGPTEDEAIWDANSKALEAIPEDQAATCVVFETGPTAEQQRDNLVSYLKGVVADHLQAQSDNRTEDWRNGFNECSLFLIEKIEDLGNEEKPL